jgi:hypothetical protein
MIRFLSKRGWLFTLGIILSQSFGFTNPLHAQCDFVNDISGIALSTAPTGAAADPTQYTQVYVLANDQNNIVATSATPVFLSLDAGNYYVYAVNYNNSEAAAVNAVLLVGQPWSGVTAYGDNVANCLDYTAQPYQNCLVTVCEEQEVCEFFTMSLPASGFNGGAGYTQAYALVVGGTIEAVQASATFDLNAYPSVVAGASAQIFAINYRTADGAPVAAGENWNATTADICTSPCYDFIGMNLDLIPVSLASGNGISTTVDWWDISDACAGAQPASNGGAPVNATLNNWCVPSYNPGAIQARPLDQDDLQQYMSAQSLGMIARVPCVGAMDLTQNTVFYTVECAPGGPSDLTVEVHSPGGAITRIEAALYGPVNPLCPVITGGSFLDCEDAGAGSLSGMPINTPLELNAANVQPGQVYLVIIDTEGREQFQVTINSVLLAAKLVDFRGTKESSHNVLNWEINQDNETQRFELERSLNGVDFNRIATLDPLRNGRTHNFYNYTDEYPGFGTKYYRLSIHSTDGTQEYSRIVALDRQPQAGASQVNVFPNPNNGNFTVEFNTTQNATVKYEIKDLLGRTIHFGQRATTQGINRFDLNISDAPTATYIITLDIEGNKTHRRIVVDNR